MNSKPNTDSPAAETEVKCLGCGHTDMRVDGKCVAESRNCPGVQCGHRCVFPASSAQPSAEVPPNEIYLGRWRTGAICEWMPSLRKVKDDDEVYVRADSVWDEAILAVKSVEVGQTFPDGYPEDVDAESFRSQIIAELERRKDI